MLKSALLQAVENHKGNRTGAEWDSHLSQSMISPGKQTRRTFFPAGPPRLSYSDPPKSDFLSTVSDQEQFLLFFPIFFFFFPLFPRNAGGKETQDSGVFLPT